MNSVRHQDEVYFNDFWQIIKKHKLLVISFMLIFGGVGIWYSFTATPVYQADSVILIGTKTPDTFSDDKKQFQEMDPTANHYYKTQYAMLQSRSLARRVVTSMDLLSEKEFEEKPPLIDWGKINRAIKSLLINLGILEPKSDQGETSKDPTSHMVDQFLNRLIISPISQSHVVNVSFQGYSPELITRITNNFIDTMIQRNIERRSKILGGSEKWMVDKLGELKKNMQAAEKKLARFRKRNDIIDYKKNREISAQNLSRYQDAIRQVKTEQLRLETLKNLLKRLKRDPIEMLHSLPDDIKTLDIKRLISDYADAVKEYEDITKHYSSKFPQVSFLEKVVRDKEKQIPREINRLIRSIDIDFQGTVVHEKSLKDAMQNEKKKIMALDNQEFTYNGLKDEFDTNKILHNDLLVRFKEIDIASYSDQSAIQIVDHAEIPQSPVKPRKGLIITLCLILGGMGGSFLSVFLERTKKSLITVEDVVRQIPLPFLGGIGIIRKKELPLPATNHVNSFVAEEFRTLKTNLMINGFVEPNKTLLISSSTPKEGKTTVVTNLAVTFAQDNKRVLIIDADFVRPKINAVLKINNQPGLIDILENPKIIDRIINNSLKDSRKIDEVFVKTVIEGVYVLPRGSLTNKFSDSINFGIFQKLMTAVKNSFDVILVDSPPALAFSYVSVVAQLCDGVLFLIGSGMKDKDLIKRTLKQLSAASSDSSFKVNSNKNRNKGLAAVVDQKSKVFGVVLNKVKFYKDDYYEYHRKYFQDYYSNMSLKSRKAVSA